MHMFIKIKISSAILVARHALAALLSALSIASNAHEDKKQIECIALAVYWESRGEPRAGQMMVANVIHNRAKHDKFPETHCSVVFQPYQFSNIETLAKMPIEEPESWEKAFDIAKLSYYGFIDKTDALFYHAETVTPKWAKSFEQVAKVGSHYFYTQED